MKLSKKSDGFRKRGIRYVDFGEKSTDKIKFLKRKPKELKK
jgi:hypothetical protein